LPPFWANELPAHGGDPSGARSGDPRSTVLPQWSPEVAIDLMDSQEIAIGILSLTAPGIVGWDKSERRKMARRVNEYTADLVAKRPDRFGNFATVPLPDVDGALSELEYALDTLGADGVILLGNYADKYLGDATFVPCGRNSIDATLWCSCIPHYHVRCCGATPLAVRSQLRRLPWRMEWSTSVATTTTCTR
jgi:predicted TIM-barrel fold metal-dependent hydrolase